MYVSSKGARDIVNDDDDDDDMVLWGLIKPGIGGL
jgi:hypothetical protein